MNEPLNSDQIAALFEAAKSGNVPEAPAQHHRRSQRMRAVDFSRPTKFTADHQRRITRAVDGFCTSAGTRLTAELRTSVEFETLNTTQVTWGATQSLIPTHSLSVTLEVRPIGTRIMLTVETAFVLNAIEGLLGGGSGRAPKDRRFSEIDWTLSRRLIESMMTQLSASWTDLGGLRFEIQDMELHADSTTIASVSEPTFVTMIEARMNKQSASLVLAIPWIAIEPVAEMIAGHDPFDADTSEDPAIERALAGVPVTLRAEVASVPLPISDILSLQPGSVIRLGVQAEDGVSLYAENVKLGRARPGFNGSRRAVQISGGAEEG